MLTARTKINKVVVIRPGALGDVLAVRSVLRFFRDMFPAVELTLAAPGERGRFFERVGLADRVFDWDRGAFAWLFADEESEPPVSLRAAFAGADIVVAYQDFSEENALEAFERRLDRLAPAAGKVFCPSRPPEEHGQPIGEWLLRAAMGFCARYGFIKPEEADTSRWRDVRVAMERRSFPDLEQPYLVIHPGSGSASKNWPLENYASLAASLLDSGQGGAGALKTLLVTAGEADGDLGKQLAAMAPGTLLLNMPELENLAAVLAHARLYIGNDSGVSHLASAVCAGNGVAPANVTIFGPSDSVVWGPPGAIVLRAGRGMDELSPEAALLQIRGLLPEFS